MKLFHPLHFRPAIFFLACWLLPAAICTATNYYADPSPAGSMQNAGTFNAPWANLSSIFAANKTFQAGDTIFLRTGNHGYALIRGMNSGYVVIMPQAGQNPVIERIRVAASATITASYWKLYRLTIQSESTGSTATPAYTLLEVYPQADHITISECIVSSNLNTTGWTRDDWRNRCNNGIFLRGRLNAHHLLEKNLILNTAFPLTVASSNTVVRENTVRYFTNDGSRLLGSYDRFEKNRIMDLIKVMTTAENHDDLFQSFVYAPGGTGQDTLKADTIRGNVFINTTDTTRAFRGNTQGIGCFDGVYLNWIIENNIVMTDHWHGIAMYGAVNCIIVNNTVLDPYPYSPFDSFDVHATNIGPAWIHIDKKSSGPPSTGNTIKNNLVANVVTLAAPSMGLAYNNISIGPVANYSTYFVDVSDFAHPDSFDLHLKPGCPAIDAGDPSNAPAFDFDGVARPQGPAFDLGAYEFVGTSAAETPTPAFRFSLYPNPSDGRLSVDFQGSKQAYYDLEIFTVLGNRVGKFGNRKMDSAGDLDLSGLEKGVYFIRLSCGGQACCKVFMLE
ncbi:MAG: choice-of-anchor Q domain-containing protein [Saprospiraceae bacterium]